MATRTLRVLMLAGALGVAAGQPTRAQQPAQSGRKRALLVAVARYPQKHSDPLLNWPQLHTDLDARNLRQVLVDRYQFREADVQVLLDAQATQQGILDAFRQHLIAPARPGDVVVFMFSGHGQLVDDPEGFAVKPDGLDPSMVPYDYISTSAKDQKERNVRGYDLQKLLKQLCDKMRGASGKVDGNITVIIDSCHSNTIARGSQVTKGRGWDERIDGPKPKPVRSGAAKGTAGGEPAPQVGGSGEQTASIREGQSSPDGSGLLPTGEALAQGYVMLTACQSHESAYEIEDEQRNSLGGALIYNLCQALRDATEKSTYRDVFDRASLEIKARRPNQTAAAEGEMNQLLFSGKAVPTRVYPVVQDYRDGIITIGAGRLHGVTPRSRYALYPPASDATDPGKRLAEVEVTAVDAYTCQAALSSDDLARVATSDPKERSIEEKLRGARAVMTAQYFGDEKLRVLLEGTGRLAAALKAPGVPEEQDPLQLISVDPRGKEGGAHPPHDIRIIEGNARPVARDASAPDGARELVVLRDDNTEVTRVPDDPRAPETLRALLRREWRRRLLIQTSLTPSDSLLDVTPRVCPVQVDRLPNGRYRKVADVADSDRTRSGRLLLREGQFFQIELENRGHYPAYVAVLDLQPDGTIAPIFPNRQLPQVVSPFLEAGATVRLPGIFRVTAPFGDDIYLAIATTERVDFEPLIYSSENMTTSGEQQKRGAEAEQAVKGVKGSLSPLARLLFNASTGTRRGEPVPTALVDWSIQREIVETRPR